MVTWQDRLREAREYLGDDLSLELLLVLAQAHKMTPEEIEAQRQSWARQDMD